MSGYPSAAETRNKFLVSARGEDVYLLGAPLGGISADDALNLAAWLVAIAQPSASLDFDDLLTVVQSGDLGSGL
jgi:hypothetical protein